MTLITPVALLILGSVIGGWAGWFAKDTALAVATGGLWFLGAIPFGEAWIAFILILAFGDRLRGLNAARNNR